MTAPAASGFRHEALFFRDEADYLAMVLPLLHQGLAADDVVVVLEPASRLALVQEALGADSSRVEFGDVTAAGANPGRLLPLLVDAVAAASAAGRGLTAVGEPVFPGRRAAELAECEMHEALVNVTFGPATRGVFVCAYDAGLPASVRSGALRTHSWFRDADGTGPSPDYLPAADGVDLATLPACDPLPPPTDVVLRGEFGLRDVPAVRRTVRAYARSCGLDSEQVENLELAASELASNCIRHGGGSGSLAMWRDPDAVVVEFSCPGRFTDPLAGRRRPDPLGNGGMGLYLVQQLCDLLQIRTGPAGTTARVSTWAPSSR
jgi:anti-sigma regulatory factor (Ser/Thr protein kinase)